MEYKNIPLTHQEKKEICRRMTEILEDKNEIWIFTLITKWLDDNNFIYTYYSPSFLLTMYNSGVKVLLDNDYFLSIQTDPSITGRAFSQTSLLFRDKISDDFMYEDENIINHDTPEDLYRHIRVLQNLILKTQEEKNYSEMKSFLEAKGSECKE